MAVAGDHPLPSATLHILQPDRDGPLERRARPIDEHFPAGKVYKRMLDLLAVDGHTRSEPAEAISRYVHRSELRLKINEGRARAAA